MHFIPICILTIEDEQDCELIQSLYVKYSAMMHRVALRILFSRADTEDVVSSACVALIKNVDRLKSINPRLHKAYIMSTVRNEAKMVLRRRDIEHRGLKKVADEQILAEEEKRQEVDEELIYNCTRDALKRAIMQLSPADREILQLKVFDGLSDSVIAELLNVRIPTVRSKLRRARIRLHAVMEVNNDVG